MPTVFPRGQLSGADTVHAGRSSLSGLTALCGAGRLAQELPGRFDPQADGVCPKCVAAVAAAR